MNYQFVRNQEIRHREMCNSVLSQKNHNKIHSMQILASYYEGQCNFLIFMKSVKPYLHKMNSNSFRNINLHTFFANFDKVSIFGLDISYILETGVANVNYSPTLSSMEIMISDKVSVEKLLKKMKKEDFLKEKNVQKTFEFYLTEDCKLRYFQGKITIEYYEDKPPYSRTILSEQINYILGLVDGLKEVMIPNVNQNSWFSIIWNPCKTHNHRFTNTSFLVYYQFQVTDSLHNMCSSQYLEIPIIGILPINFEEILWLRKINNKSQQFNNIGYTLNEHPCEFKQILFKSIENVDQFILKQNNKISYDYKVFLNNKIY